MSEPSVRRLIDRQQIVEKTITSLLVIVIVGSVGGIGTLVWNQLSNGGLIRALGGITRESGFVELPTGVIVIVDDARGCEALGEKWVDAGLGGRFPVGAIRGDGRWNYRQAGGQSSVALNPKNMPLLYIDLIQFNIGKESDFRYAVQGFSYEKSTLRSTGGYYNAGNESPVGVDILPPYLPLYFCRKRL